MRWPWSRQCQHTKYCGFMICMGGMRRITSRPNNDDDDDADNDDGGGDGSNRQQESMFEDTTHCWFWIETKKNTHQWHYFYSFYARHSTRQFSPIKINHRLKKANDPHYMHYHHPSGSCHSFLLYLLLLLLRDLPIKSQQSLSGLDISMSIFCAHVWQEGITLVLCDEILRGAWGLWQKMYILFIYRENVNYLSRFESCTPIARTYHTQGDRW